MIQRIYFLPALLLLTLLLYRRGNAQLPDYHVQLFDERDGIRTNAERILKDDHGFVWIAYGDRVQRYDGKQMKEFILDDRINSIITDQQNNVWITSRSNVYLYENRGNEIKMAEVDRAKKMEIGSVFQLPGNEILLLTSIGFYALNTEHSKFVPVEDENYITSSPVNIRRWTSSQIGYTFFYSSNDTLWSHDVRSGHKRHLPVENLLALHALNESQVLVSTWRNQSYLFDLESQKTTAIHPSKYLLHHKDDFLLIHDVVKLDTHRYLLATSKGMLEFISSSGYLSQKQFYFKGQPLSNVGKSVDLHLDRDQKVWACLENSIMFFDPFNEVIGLMRNTQMDQVNGYNSQIRSIAEDEKKNLWLATNNGITYWDLRKNELTSLFAVEGATDRMNHPSVRGIAHDGTYVIIGQANRGIWLYHPETKKYRSLVYEPGQKGVDTKRKLENDFVDHIYRLQNGNHFVSARDGAYLLDRKNYLIRIFDFPGSKENLSFCYEDQLKQVWIGTAKGIHCLDSNLIYQFSVKEGIGSGSVSCFLQWRTNEYLLGAKGLYLVTQTGDSAWAKTWNHFFDRINIISIYRDSSDRLWLATDRGLYRYTHATGHIEPFDYFDHIQGDVYVANSMYVNEDGMLFLGGANGINYFHPDRIHIRKDSLIVSLMKVRVNEDDTSYYNRASLLSLRPNQNSIEIEFIAPYYGNTNRIQYRYQLEGLTDTWNHIGQTNVVRFTALSPGAYSFKVGASANGIDWFDAEENLLFTIAIPFWQTWWFIALVIGTIAATILFFMKRRIRIIRRQEAVRRESEVQLITMNRDLAASQLTALRAQMNPHFIFNALNSVQRYILKGDVDQANKYLSKFSRLQREVLNNSNQDFISLEKEIEILELYLQLEQLRFDEKFSYTIDVEKNIDTSEIKIPPMILQPFVENAIWHGLMPRQGPKKVDIQFLLDADELLYCRIRDNGIGRAASARLKNNHEGSPLYESKGLLLVHERLQILEQLYQHSYQVDVIDRIDPAGVVEGTEVNLTIHPGR